MTDSDPIVDSHCHVSYRWYEPVDTLLFQMDRCEVERAVLVQLLGGHDNAAMIEAVRAHPGRFAWVAAIDPRDENAPRAIEELADAGAAGLRMRAAWRSAGDDPLALWRKVRGAGLAVSLVGPATSFTDGSLAEIAGALPGLPLVIEHLGGLARPDVGNRDAVLPAIADLAEHPGIMLKLPGLGQIAPRLPLLETGDIPLDLAAVGPLIDRLVTAFGSDRLMWGSDFPPVAAREGYANALNWTRDFIAANHPGSEAGVFGGNAARVWFGR